TLAGLLRAIELNGVAVENNKLAFSLGRLAAAQPRAIERLLSDAQAAATTGTTATTATTATAATTGEPAAAADDQAQPLDDLVARAKAHLTAYQNAAYARRFEEMVARVRRREEAVAAERSMTAPL